MKIYILMLLTFCLSNVYAQKYPSEISFEINQQKFLVTVKHTPDYKAIITFFRDSLQVKSDTVHNSNVSRIYFRGFNKDSSLSIRLFGYKNGDYVYESKSIEILKLLSLDIDPHEAKYSKLYEYNQKQKNFNSVIGFESIPKPEILKTNPHYFTSTRTFECEFFQFITTLYCINNLKISSRAQMLGLKLTDDYPLKVVELYEINKSNENQKTMIDRQMTCTQLPVCTGEQHRAHFADSDYWEKHCTDFKTYKLGIYLGKFKPVKK